jgi:hypothetical protein
MAGYNDKNFNDRREAAEKAKRALLEKFQARPGPDDPTVVARQEERKLIAEARAERERLREIAREEERKLQAEREAQRRAEELTRIAEEKAAAAAAAAAEAELKAEQKAARDRRYAARKARR